MKTTSGPNKGKSISLVSILLLATLMSLVTIPTASAINETSSGVITGTETWSGTHNLIDNVTVAEGAKLTINAGTTINIPAGKHINVGGSICAGDAGCGATQASASSTIRFLWATTGPNDKGGCLPIAQGDQGNIDAACGGGLYIGPTVDLAETGMSFVHFEDAYGFNVLESVSNTVRYGALIIDGSSPELDHLSFTDINGSNIIALDFASPTITDSTFTIGVDAQTRGPAIQAYGAGAGILSSIVVRDSTFTGETQSGCSGQQAGINMIYAEESFIDFERLDFSENTFGVLLKSSSGWIGNSTFDVKCSGVNTNGFKTTGTVSHTLYVDNNVIETEEGAGITAYDGARVSAHNNVISGASAGSGVAVSSSTLTMTDSNVGPISGYNGFWIYGSSDVVIENTTIQDTAAEPVLLGEYHFNDQGWNVPAPTSARLKMANSVISNNSGTCNSLWMYDGDFNCPAIHIFMSSATLIGNTITNNQGDGLRIKAGIVNVQDNNIETSEIGANISHYDDTYGSKHGTIGYFSGNTYTNASQIYNISESRVTVQSEFIPDVSAPYYPVMLEWTDSECPFASLDVCLKLPSSYEKVPQGMPLAIELVNNSTVFSFADLQNFDTSKIFVQNQNTEWGTQVRQGELVRYQVKSGGSNVADATVVIKDANGKPLYSMQTDAFGFTPQVSLPSDFMIDRNWNHIVGEQNVDVPGTPTVESITENSCSDGYDNDGDTKVDVDDTDCVNGRELAFYTVEAFKFGKGENEFSFSLTGGIDEVINLNNLPPSVTVDQIEGASFAQTITLTGSAWDGEAGPYALDQIAYEKQFGLVQSVEIQPPGQQTWYSAVDTSGANGEITRGNHPFKTWSFDWDMSGHPEGESDVTFRIRSNDGLALSPVSVRDFKLNLVAPSLILSEPLDGSTHRDGNVLFSGTASDPYSGTQGSDIQNIWIDIEGPNDYTSRFPIQGTTTWAYDWDFSDLPTGQYTFKVWASDSDFCIGDFDGCSYEERTINVNNDNVAPFVTLSSPGDATKVRADSATLVQGVARDTDGAVTRVEITIIDLASQTELFNGPNPVTSFAPNGAWQTTWDTSNLIHDQQYEIVVKSYDGEDYSPEVRIRITIDNPSDSLNNAPTFNETLWPSVVTIFCDSGSSSSNQCGGGASVDLAQYFSDADVVSTNLIYDVFDSASSSEDDYYYGYITISANGVATYDPVDNIATLPSEISEWSLSGVQFEARDEFDSSVLSYPVTFLVKEVKFDVERDDVGEIITTNDPASFSGTGLPDSKVIARYKESGFKLNETRVDENGDWQMFISASQLASEERADIIFEMDGQYYRTAEQGEDEQASFVIIPEASVDEGISLLWIIIGIVVVLGLILAVGFVFFVEFEEEIDLAEEDQSTQETQADPYAWAKKSTTEISAAGGEQPAQAAQATQAAAASSHPGWIWDAQKGEWVADPNYQPPSQ